MNMFAHIAILNIKNKIIMKQQAHTGGNSRPCALATALVVYFTVGSWLN